MHKYSGVITRFLRPEERLIASEEKEMPLVIEASDARDFQFLQDFLAEHSVKIEEDIAKYGAVLLRGFDIKSDEDFENAVLSLKGFRGISHAFMAEHGRIPVGSLKYVLHTNAVYKTGGTLYLGGFHTENYYTPDVPSYISFCCHKPSQIGGETGLVNMEKVYEQLDDSLKEKLEKNNFFVSKWLVSEVTERYQVSRDRVLKLCEQFDLPLMGKKNNQFILMYKPNVFEHPLTKRKSLQINLFELSTLNIELRKCFMPDYVGRTWFWHRFVWRLPTFIFKLIEHIYVTIASLIYSPKVSFNIIKTKLQILYSLMINRYSLDYNAKRVGHCFDDKDVKNLAKLVRRFYVSCLWEKGDILLVDNKKVAHAGMPGKGPRRVRALISNPIEMKYSSNQSGCLECRVREVESLGAHLANGD